MVDLQLDWQREPSMRITRSRRGSDDLRVVVDPRLSLSQVTEACAQMGDAGWEVLGRWCSLMRPSMGSRRPADLNSTALGIVTPDQTIRWLGPQFESLLGWPSQALIGRSVLELVHPDQVHMAKAFTDGLVKGGRAQGNLLMRTADGAYRNMSGNVIRWPSSEPAVFLGEWRPAHDAVTSLRAAPASVGSVGDNAA